MQEHQLIKFIENILAKREKKALVVVTGGVLYQKEIFYMLAGYQEVAYQYVVSPAASTLEPLTLWQNIGPRLENPELVSKAVEKSDCVILPSLTRNSLAKIALGLADTLALVAVQLALMMGKPVVAVDACWNPENERSQIMGWNKSQMYNSMLFTYRDQTERLGMQSVTVAKLSSVLEPLLAAPASKTNFVGDIPASAQIPGALNHVAAVQIRAPSLAEAVQTGCEICGPIVTQMDVIGKNALILPQAARLTDLAREYIHTHDIKVTRVNSK